MNSLPKPSADLLNGASLFLDFDGTLVEIAAQPDAVQVDGRVIMLMDRLSRRLEGRIAVISGRSAAQVRDLLGGPVMTVVGCHGLEFHWADGRVEAMERPDALERVLSAAHALAQNFPGTLVEDKPLGVALHFRQAPAAEQASVDLAVRLAAKFGLELQPGKMMVELRATGGDKGSAVRILMREPLFAGTRPLFLGDDLTDEAGFLAARTMSGAGVLVGAQRPTAAGYRLANVSEVVAWLEAACHEVS